MPNKTASGLPVSHRSILFTILALLAIVISATATVSYRKQNSHVIPSHKATPTQQNSSKSTSQATPSAPVITSGEKSSTQSSSNPSESLAAPSGSFVSNHHPNSSDTLQSQCSTTPGAKCYIKFTMGSRVKSLTEETAANGTVYWTWKISDAGLSSGSWQIEAFSSLNGQSLSTKDPLTLEIQ